MSNKNSRSNHKNHRKKQAKAAPKGCSQKNQSSALKLVAFENSLAGKSTQSDIKRASFLFNNLQRQIIKTRITKIHLN